MTSTDSPTLAAGTMLAHYEIRKELGSGAMGTVYEAQDTALDRLVAVKVLKASAAQLPGVVERFVREARAAARVNHNNLAHIYFVGECDAGRFFAMEHLPGETLEERVERQGPMGLTAALDVLIQAAHGLAAAHKGNVIHRDVKPSNLMILADGTVKVADFGLAISLEGDARLTGGGTIMGTPKYMSPEQCRGDDADERTDIYALGLVGYFLLSGKAAFDGDHVGKVLEDQLSSPLPSLAADRPEIPEQVDEVLARFCAKDPAKRPANMDEVVELLEELRPRPLLLAPLLARASASVVDLVAIGIVVGALVLAVLLAESKLEQLLPQSAGGRVASYVSYATQLIVAGILLAATVGLERMIGSTVGKYFFNLEVVRDDGTHPSTARLVARFLCRFPIACMLLVPGEFHDILWNALPITFTLAQMAALVIGFPWALATEGKTLSDLATKTRVVYRLQRGAGV